MGCEVGMLLALIMGYCIGKADEIKKGAREIKRGFRDGIRNNS